MLKKELKEILTNDLAYTFKHINQHYKHDINHLKAIEAEQDYDQYLGDKVALKLEEKSMYFDFKYGYEHEYNLFAYLKENISDFDFLLKIEFNGNFNIDPFLTTFYLGIPMIHEPFDLNIH